MNTIRLSLFALPLSLAFAMAAAMAQTNPPPTVPPTTVPPATTAAPLAPTSSSATVPPVPGANSFTEGEARSRIEASGYTNVTDLQKDSQSIWRGKAMKDGKPVNVALDFQGHVVAE